VKSLQLLHICSPFGESWYLTTLCEILAASAGRVAASIVAAPLAHIAPPNKERLETCTDVILQTFVMIIFPCVDSNRRLSEDFSIRRNQAPFQPPSKICRDGINQTPVLENSN
jgi:hypothetical protein